MAVPTVLESLEAARANYAAQLAELSDPNRRRMSYSIDGVSCDWTAYATFLKQMIADIKDAIADEDGSAGTITATAIR